MTPEEEKQFKECFKAAVDSVAESLIKHDERRAKDYQEWCYLNHLEPDWDWFNKGCPRPD